MRGHLAAIPWVMFGVAATLTAIGAVSPAAVAIVAPIALGFAAQYKISPLLMGLLVVHGAQAGGFSPISVYGSIVNGVVADNGLPQDEVFLFFASLAVNLLIAAVVFVAFGGLKLLRTQPAVAAAPGPGGGAALPAAALTVGGRPPIAGGSPEADALAAAPAAERLTAPTPYQALTLLGLVALVVCTLAFDLDVGFVAVTVAVTLAMFSQATAKEAVGQITWSVVLLICGVLTYVGVLEQIGTIDYVGDAVADVGAPLIAALLLCYIGAIVSAFASSVGVLGATIPLGRPVPADRGRRCGRVRGCARDLLHARRREPVLDQRRAGAGQRPERRPRRVLQAAAVVRRGHHAGGPAGRLVLVRRPRHRLNR